MDETATATTTNRDTVKNNPARGPRSAPRRRSTGNTQAERETIISRFEFARRHILTEQKLETQLHDAEWALWKWTNEDEFGQRLKDRYGFDTKRKVKTPEDREALKVLEATVTDLRAKLLLHENDGRLL